MPATQAKKTERLETRVTPQQKQIIERAAILRGTNTSNFVLMVVQQAASETIRDSETLTLRGEASKLFVESLLNPPAPNAALRAAAKRHLSVRS